MSRAEQNIDIREILSPELYKDWLKLRERAVQTAGLRHDIPNYVALDWVNRTGKIDKEAEQKAAQIIRGVFKEAHPDIILTIGNSGISFGQALQNQFKGSRLAIAEKLEGDFDPKRYEEVVPAYSYSRQQEMFFGMPAIPEGSEVFLADDVSALGSIGTAIGKAALRKRAVRIDGYGVYFDKAFQNGLQGVVNTLSVPGFSVIRVADVTHKNGSGHITLLPEEVAGKMVLPQKTDAPQITRFYL